MVTDATEILFPIAIILNSPDLRMTVRDVLEYLAGGMTVDEILADFPDLTLEDIRACLAFAADSAASFLVLS